MFQKNIYDADGKKNGLSQEFDKDGAKYLEFDYKKGNIIAYRIFDKTGKNIAYSVYQYLTFGAAFGGIEFLKFSSKSKDLLTAQKRKIYVPRGIHALHAIREF